MIPAIVLFGAIFVLVAFFLIDSQLTADQRTRDEVKELRKRLEELEKK